MNFLDFEDIEIADEIFRSIEKDYGRGIARVAFFEHANELNCFDIKIIFTDFKLLEAKIIVIPSFGIATVKVDGIYY